MKITHTYCDVCGKQMDWQSGSSQYVNGFEIEGELAVGVRVRSGGPGAASNSSWQAATFSKTHICSTICLQEEMMKFVARLTEKKVASLEEF